MFVTIWTCTHEWSLIPIRATAFTFWTCHQPLSWSSRLARSRTCRSFLLPRSGSRIRICATASRGVRRVSRCASSETGSSIRSWVSGSSSTGGAYVRLLAVGRAAHDGLRLALGRAEAEVHLGPDRGDERPEDRVPDDVGDVAR